MFKNLIELNSDNSGALRRIDNSKRGKIFKHDKHFIPSSELKRMRGEFLPNEPRRAIKNSALKAADSVYLRRPPRSFESKSRNRTAIRSVIPLFCAFHSKKISRSLIRVQRIR